MEIWDSESEVSEGFKMQISIKKKGINQVMGEIIGLVSKVTHL